MATTPVADIKGIVDSTRSAFIEGISRNVHWRIHQLHQLKKCIEENEKELKDALHKDLNMNPLAQLNEFQVTFSEIRTALNHIHKWVKPEKVSVPLLQQPGSCTIYKEPVGVVLIISAFNYPLSLVTRPLIAAIAAGNCAVIKPTEVAANTSAAVARIFPKYLDQKCVRFVCGGIPETTEVLKQQFDHIFYTGNGTVGKIIMKAAAEYLTPVTLELGGKSPCIVDKNVDMTAAVNRICWGKFFNAGQTCIAPDYILVHKDVEQKFLDSVVAKLKQFYGEDPSKSVDFERIINERHTKRLGELFKDGGKILYGGQYDEAKHYVAPTLITNVNLNSRLMTDEIFGPILPVIPYNDDKDAVQFIVTRPKPLAIYVFSTDQKFIDYILNNTSSGGGCINETLMHNVCLALPFGGVGPSGMGAYGGRHGFDLLSHRKGFLRKPMMAMLDPPARFPPYTESNMKLLHFLYSIKLPEHDANYIIIALVAIIIGLLLRMNNLM